MKYKNETPALKAKWSDDRYSDRHHNNPLRRKQYLLDAAFIRRFVNDGIICDVGCGTGEFLETIKWNGLKFGMEISDTPKRIAEKKGIDFNKNIFTEENFFDVIVFRGTIQHVDNPFLMMKSALQSLKSGGFIFFIATPNSESWLYRRKLRLPALSKEINFYVPGALQLKNALSNFGYHEIVIDRPYLDTPYAHPVTDHFKFLINLFTPYYLPHAFWGSMINVCAKKP